MIKRAAFAFSFLLCTSAFGADEPKWLKEARAREAKLAAPAEINSKDGWFKFRAPGKVANAIEKVEGSYSVEFDLGTQAPVQCEVFPEGVDLANGLRVTFENAIKANPSMAMAHYQLGMANLNLGDIPGARAAFQEYLKVDPNGPKSAEVKTFVSQLPQ